MSELRVPTRALEADIVCADGRTFSGRIFLPSTASRHSGPMRPAEWMNDGVPFFPFLPAGAETSFILNKTEVLILTVAAEAEEDEEAAVLPLRRVIVECRDRSISGTIAIDMPENLSRVVDYLNRHDTFLIVQDGLKQHLIRKARITRVIEPRQE